MFKSTRLQTLALCALISSCVLVQPGFGAPNVALMSSAPAEPESELVTVDATAPTKPFKHFWEHMFGGCRASLSLRESYRNDIKKTKSIVDMQYVRFHGIFMDDVGVYDEDKDGKAIYNWTYIDQIYDGLLNLGIRPYVELSFMPGKLASKESIFGFWYKPNVAPPKDWNKWGEFMNQFANHLIQRYGIDEVSNWYFEVWNEPNIGFWEGEPKESTYYKLYDVTARALKRANPRLRVGGPATAQAAWISSFIDYCDMNDVPVDFVSTHVYANDTAHDVFGTEENIPRKEMTIRAMRKVHDQVQASKKPNLPIIWSEFNASYFNEQNVTDSAFMGPWLANLIGQVDGLADEISYWTFSDVFEEGGVAKTPYYGGFGLIAPGGIPKAAYNAFKLLHLLGDERIAVQDSIEPQNAIATKRPDGTVVVAAWNYTPPGESGHVKKVCIKVSGTTQPTTALVHQVDAEHGSSLQAWEAMGRPPFPSREQQKALRACAELSPPTVTKLDGRDAMLSLDLQPQELAVIEFKSVGSAPAKQSR